MDGSCKHGVDAARHCGLCFNDAVAAEELAVENATAAEREACAKVADTASLTPEWSTCCQASASAMAAAIRERGAK